MKLAGHTMGTPTISVPDALRLFSSLGLEGAEIIWQNDYLSAIPETASDDDLRRVRSLALDLELEIACLTPYMTGLNSLDAAERAYDMARFERCIQASEQLACRHIRIYAGRYLPGELQREEKWSRLVDSLHMLSHLAEKSGVVLCIENHFNTMTVTAAETAALMQAVDAASLGILYDQGNLTFTHNEPFEEAISLQRAWIRYVHVKDLVFTDPDRPFHASDVARVGGEHRAVHSRVVGDGILEWPAILARLTQAGYDGYLSMEYEYRWHPQDLPPPAEGFRRGAEYLRQLLAAQAVSTLSRS